MTCWRCGGRSVLDAIPIAADARVFYPYAVQKKEIEYRALQAALHTVPFGTLADELADTGSVSGATAWRTALDSTIFLFPAAGALKAAGYATTARAVAGTAFAIEFTDSSIQAVEGINYIAEGERLAGAAQVIFALAQVVFSVGELRQLGKVKAGDWTAFQDDFLAGLKKKAPRTKHWTDFADEAAAIQENAARSRGLNPNSGIVAAQQTRDVDIPKLIPPSSRPFADPAKLQRHGPFDWKKYTPIIVETDGTRFWIMDGMTRMENARRAGITKFPAYVYPRR